MTAICEQIVNCDVASSVASFSYDSLGRPDIATISGATTDHDFDDLSRLELLSHDMAGTSADQSLSFGYNPASQITTRIGSNTAYASTTIVDDTRSYAVNGLNQYTSVDGSTHSYDLNGNLSSDGATSYSYDAENRLVSAGTVTLEYDPLGRLFEIGGGTQFLYDGDALVAEYDGSGNLQRRYVHGTGVDTPVLWYEGSGLTTRRGLLADHQGSIIAVVDAAGGSFEINGYDSWGVPNSTNKGRFQYTGQAWLDEIGLYHYKARIYSPELGRFLQTDPVGYEDQMNLYAFVGNDPLNMRDPSGEFGIFGAGLGLLIGGTVGGITNAIAQAVGGNGVDLTDVAIAAVSGATAGAIIGGTGGTSLLFAGAVSSGASVAGSVASDVSHGRDINVTNAVAAGIAGGAGGAAGGAVGRAVASRVGSGTAGTIAAEGSGAAVGEGVAVGVTTGENVVMDAAREGNFYPNSTEHPLPPPEPPDLEFGRHAKR